MSYDINQRIKEVRQALNLSQPEFGKRIGVSRDVIANIERTTGAVTPNEILLQHICSVYHVDPIWLETGEGEMFSLDESKQTLADRIRLVRKFLEMTQQEFADSLSVNRSIIKNYELSIVSPTNIFINHMCMKHGINKDWILYGSGEMLSQDDTASSLLGIAQRIRELRKHLDMTQTEFGESLGVSREVINTYEHGKVLPPHTVTELLHLKHNVNPNWLNSGEGEMFLSVDDASVTTAHEILFGESSLKHLLRSPDLIDRSISFLQVLRSISSMNDYERSLVDSFLRLLDGKEKDTE